MKEYRFSDSNAEKTVKSQMITSTPIFLIGIGGGFYIANNQYDGILFNNPLILVLTIIICIVAVVTGLIIGYKNNKKSLMKNVYRITENGIERKTPSDKTVIINFNQIKEQKTLKSGLLIKSTNHEILIPSRLDNYNEITAIINENLR